MTDAPIESPFGPGLKLEATPEQLGPFFKAWGAALAEIGGAIEVTRKVDVEGKNKATGAPVRYSFKYLELAPILATALPRLANQGLSFSQVVHMGESGYLLTSILGHESGAFLWSQIPIVIDGNDKQAFGKAITFLRRYTAAPMLGIAAEDSGDPKGLVKPSASTQRPKPAADQRPPAAERRSFRESDPTSCTGEQFQAYNDAVAFVLDKLGKKPGEARLKKEKVPTSEHVNSLTYHDAMAKLRKIAAELGREIEGGSNA